MCQDLPSKLRTWSNILSLQSLKLSDSPLEEFKYVDM
uniref:Uncharacterized protein n=1 Tax=Arundo donax TaxID=35708 RepID=A0A0A9B5X7_ARUDO